MLKRDEDKNELYKPLFSIIALKPKKEMLYFPLDFEIDPTLDALLDSEAYFSATAESK